MMTSLFQDPTFWVAISTVCFFAFLAVKGRAPVIAGLDARSQTIANRIAEAEHLKTEATELLAHFKTKMDSAVVEAAGLLQDAKDRTTQMEQTAKADLARSITRIQESANLRIKQAEQAAINTVRTQVINHTRRLVERQLAGQPHNISSGSIAQLLR
jgi:F-type H+-transporting ATPase subunit b